MRYAGRIAAMRAETESSYNATVVTRQDLHPGLIILRVKPDGQLFDFEPGQFTVLGLLPAEPRVPEADEESRSPEVRLIRRAYSIASSSVQRGYLEFYLNLVTSGELTPRLFALCPGSRLFLGNKATGVFTLDRVAPPKAVLFIATATGLAPYVSMLRTHLIRDSERRYVVLHGARTSWDLGYRRELESLAKTRANLAYLPSITRPKADPTFAGLTGRIPHLLERGVIEEATGLPIDPATFDVFLCGNPGMIEDVKDWLVARGFVPDERRRVGTIHVEEYW